MNEYKQVENIDVINLDESRRLKLEDLIVEKTKGDPENITEPVLVKTIKELIALENINLTKELQESKLKDKSNEETIRHQKERIIELAGKPYYNKLGLGRVKIYLAKNIGFILSVVLLVIFEYISSKIDINKVGNIIKWIVAALPIVAEILIFIIDKFQQSKRCEVFFVKRIVKSVFDKYANTISTNIGIEEREYALDIIKMCVNNTPLLNQYKNNIDYFGEYLIKNSLDNS